LLTMVFGVIAYFLYKAREKKKGAAKITYDEALEAEERELLFFTKE